MPLYIRNDDVDRLAAAVMKTTGAKSKTDAVREALLARLNAVRERTPLLDRIRPILDEVEQLGQEDVNFDMKRYTDQMWGDS